jgi:HK97 family phage major capsid protein
MASRLEVVNGLVATKRARMGELLAKRKARGADAPFTEEELKEFVGLNGELDPLSKEQETLQLVEKAATETEAYIAGQKAGGADPGGLPHQAKQDLIDTLQLKDERGQWLSEEKIKDAIDGYAKTKAAEMIAGGGLNHGALMGFEPQPEQKAALLADLYVKSDAFKKYSKVARKSPEAEVVPDFSKALFDTSAFPIQSIRSNVLLPILFRRLVIEDLLPSGTITQPRFLYMVETVATNNAAPVAEGGTKPESALAFAEESADVRKIATVLPVTDEMFEDAPLMRSYVQQRLLTFLSLARENQILNGSGVAPNILGILNNPGIQSHSKGADSIADALYKAVTLIEVNAKLNASGIVMHPTDWQTVRLAKDSVGQYLFGSPLAGDIERIFGYPVVKSLALTQGTSLPGAWDTAAMFLRRTGVAFAVAMEHADFFIKNLLMLRVEERVALPVFRPQGFVEVDLLS